MRRITQQTLSRVLRLLDNTRQILRSETDLAGRQTPAIEQLLQQPKYQLIGPQLLRVLRLFRATRAISQTGHGVSATPSQEIPGVLGADERHDSPERTEVPRLLFRLQIELANIQKRHELDDAPCHGERFRRSGRARQPPFNREATHDANRALREEFKKSRPIK